MPGLLTRSAQFGSAPAPARSASPDGIWSNHRDSITFDQLQKFWSELPLQARKELLRLDKQALFEQARRNVYCSRCNGLLLEGFSQIMTYGKSLQQEDAGFLHSDGAGTCQSHNSNDFDEVQDPSLHPWGGLTTTKHGILTVLDCFICARSLKTLQNDIVHGDIKPDNLLVTRGAAVKIGDFSVSHAFEDGNDELCRSPGTPVFTAPECCLGSSYHGKVADIWAVGVTLYCMILGCCPFVGDSFKDTYDKIVQNPLNLPNEFDPELKDLLQGLLCKDPAHRMTLDAIADHPWIIRDSGPIPRTSCRCKSGSFRKENQMGSKSDTNVT